MGSTCSSNVSAVREAQKLKASRMAYALEFSDEEINSLFHMYKKLDVDANGMITVHEFIVCYGISCELFGEMVFRLLDKDRSGQLDFTEYIVAIWNYCSLDKNALTAFTFQIFDTDGSGKSFRCSSSSYSLLHQIQIRLSLLLCHRFPLNVTELYEQVFSAKMRSSS